MTRTSPCLTQAALRAGVAPPAPRWCSPRGVRAPFPLFAIWCCAAAAAAAGQLVELDPGALPPWSNYGGSVAISGDRVAVSDSYFSRVYVYERQGAAAQWELVARLQERILEKINLGSALAMEGDWLVATSRSDAFVYHRTEDAGWALQATIEPPDGIFESVSLSRDTVLFGGPYLGRAFFYRRHVNGTWRLHQQIAESMDGWFGQSVAIQGSRALIGEPHKEFGDWEANPEEAYFGAVHVYERNQTSGIWEAVALISTGPENKDDRVGFTVALDGDQALFGLPQRETPGTFLQNKGGAQIWSRDAATGLWTLDTELFAPVMANDGQFGESVALSQGRALVGRNNNYCCCGYFCEDTFSELPGKAYSFVQLETGEWAFEAEFKSGEPDPFRGGFDNFGAIVSLDGNRVAIGASSSAHAYVATLPFADFSQSCLLSLTIHGVPGASMAIFAGPLTDEPVSVTAGACTVQVNVVATFEDTVVVEPSGQFAMSAEFSPAACAATRVQVVDLATCERTDPMRAVQIDA